MFNDEIYNNGSRLYFDIWRNGGILNSSILSLATHLKQEDHDGPISLT